MPDIYRPLCLVLNENKLASDRDHFHHVEDPAALSGGSEQKIPSCTFQNFPIADYSIPYSSTKFILTRVKKQNKTIPGPKFPGAF